MATRDRKQPIDLGSIAQLYQMLNPDPLQQQFLQQRIQSMVGDDAFRAKELAFKEKALAADERQSAAEIAARSAPREQAVDPMQKMQALIMAGVPNDRAYQEAFGGTTYFDEKKASQAANLSTLQQQMAAGKAKREGAASVPTEKLTTGIPGFVNRAAEQLTGYDQLPVASGSRPSTPQEAVMGQLPVAAEGSVQQPFDYTQNPNGPVNPVISNVMQYLQSLLSKIQPPV